MPAAQDGKKILICSNHILSLVDMCQKKMVVKWRRCFRNCNGGTFFIILRSFILPMLQLDAFIFSFNYLSVWICLENRLSYLVLRILSLILLMPIFIRKYFTSIFFTFPFSYLKYSHTNLFILVIVMLWVPSILQTTALKNGALRHEIHYWLGKDTSQVSLFFE